MSYVRLICGDCLVEMPMLGRKVDAIITDPPYGVSERTTYQANGRGIHGVACNDFAPVYGDDKPFDPSPWLDYPCVVLFGANHYCSRLPDSARWLVWDKRDGIASNDNADCEMAWTNMSKPARLFHHLWSGMIKASEQNQRRVYPTQKPVALMKWVIQQCSLPKGALIVDPYMGSGSTILAAYALGYDAVGIEITQNGFDIASRRVSEAQLQTRMEFEV